jgi:hypothetical protein
VRDGNAAAPPLNAVLSGLMPRAQVRNLTVVLAHLGIAAGLLLLHLGCAASTSATSNRQTALGSFLM